MNYTLKPKLKIFSNPPQVLDSNSFYGIECNEEQKVMRDAIWSDDIKIVFSDSKAGTGKTLIAVATGLLLTYYGRYNGIVYVTSPTQERILGYSPGTIEEKTSKYYDPLFEAINTLGYEVDELLDTSSRAYQKGTPYIKATTHAYLRGCNFESKVVIIDEAQNFYFDELKKTLTRVHDSCKVIVIGHHDQCDLYKNPNNSGFVKYLHHFETRDYCKVCNLTQNYRGEISRYADLLV